MSRARRVLLALATSLPALAFATVTHAYDLLTWHSIDGGGVTIATGGGYTLGGTIGQPDAGTLAYGPFTLRGGFWTGGAASSVGVDETPPPALAFHFFPAWPNPVRSRSRVAFDLPRAARVALSLFDVSGRAVHRWDFGLVPAGHQERAWSAVDEGGRPLPGGVYFLRLDTDREQGLHKVVVVR